MLIFNILDLFHNFTLTNIDKTEQLLAGNENVKFELNV